MSDNHKPVEGQTHAAEEPEESGVRRLVSYASELLLTMLQVVVFFLAFMMILMLSFPQGTGLDNLYGELIDKQAGERHAGPSIGGSRSLDEEFVAVLQSVTRNVKDRPEDAIAWRNSDAGMPILDRHAVQTLARSSATIAFDDDTLLELGENSVVVIKHPVRRGQRSRRAALVVLGGDVRGRLRGGGKREVEIVTAQGTTRMAVAEDGSAEFALSVDGDKQSTLSVFAGTATIDTGERGTIEVGPNEAITMDADGTTGTPRAIPARPTLYGPGADESLVLGVGATRVSFRWGAVSGAESYRIRIARDPGMDDGIVDEIVDRPVFAHNRLSSGVYYWTVTALSGPLESLDGEIRRVEVLRDESPPTLEVELPAEVVTGDTFTFAGQAEPGATISIGGVPVATDAAGRFEFRITLEPGPNLVVVEAADAAGNITYYSQYVHAKF